MGDKQTKTQEQQSNTPWAAQQPYLLDAFSDAQNIYKQQQGNPGYQGDFVAQPTDQMVGAFQNSLGWGSGTGTTAANTAASTGTQNAAMGTAGTQGALAGLMGSAGANSTQNNINAASQYATNPFMDQMVQAATRDAGRQFSEQDIPNLNRTAAATGNMNSSRTGVAEGILSRGLADKTADISANLRGQAYQSGISQAQQDTATRNAALTSAGGLSAGATGNGLSGLTGAAGINKDNTASNLVSAQSLQGFNQAPLDNEIAKYTQGQQLPWQNLQNLFNIVGGKSWGSEQTGTSTKTETPSTMAQIGQGVGIFSSLFGGK